MKVFISWSGERSKAAAKLLNEWIPCVIQAVKPWLSTEDIEKGSIWFKEVTDILKYTSVGIMCLTPENKDKPWILFEAGALLSGLSESRVYTFLIDLKSEEVEKPLAEFNHTFPIKEDIFRLLISINNQLKDQKLDEKILEKAFNTYWLDFDKRFKEILEIKPSKKSIIKPRTEESIMNEVLLTVRSLEQRLREGTINECGISSLSVRTLAIAKDLVRRDMSLPQAIKIFALNGIDEQEATYAYRLEKACKEHEKNKFNEFVAQFGEGKS